MRRQGDTDGAFKESPLREFVVVGNAVSVDFVNTELIAERERIDVLTSDRDLARWAGIVGIPVASPRLLPARSRHAAVGELRDAVRQLFACHVAERPPNRRAVAILNRHLSHSLCQGALTVRDGALHQDKAPARTARDILAHVAADAAALLTASASTRLRRCENHRCILFFVDRSRGGRRRWCSMDVCGNRAKAARHRQR